ncbi:hypothetical protein [Aliterella atlantica]|uniref:Uncharacterized protein n=1 Tax=Aliterella atlantica CENA595 TaxID=1618023 RepID=A0A0D8ZXD0_9CYAN|nr:hypothetical protein [Aliterella atlantica]KJH73104.1 hypothetical protein UH38_03315 [Aliterella atlantica CENA595]
MSFLISLDQRYRTNSLITLFMQFSLPMPRAIALTNYVKSCNTKANFVINLQLIYVARAERSHQ